MQEKREEKTSGGIIIPDMMQARETRGMSKVIYIGDPVRNGQPLDIDEGDTIIYDPRFVQTYEIGKKKWLVLEQEYIIAKKVA